MIHRKDSNAPGSWNGLPSPAPATIVPRMRRSAAFALFVGMIAGAEGNSAAAAEMPKAKVGFGKLILRLDGQPDIGVAGPGHEIRAIERMRAKGFQAVGAENLVFGKDEGHRAQFIVGGTVRELECIRGVADLSCRIGLEWQVLDADADEVVYTVMSRAAVLHLAKPEAMATQLLDAVLDRLLERDGFRRTLASVGVAKADSPFAAARLETCPTGKKLPEGAEDLLRATAIVKVPGGHGSGFFVTPQHLLTAAHVVTAGSPVLELRGGEKVDAAIVRVARRADVALLRVSSSHPCLHLGATLPKVGSDAYVAGAPGPLAVSLTRGIVSGIQLIDGLPRVQTDAPINPGNSGGPVADAAGDVFGIVSFKLAGGKVEGLGFAVPTGNALAALGLNLGEKTDELLFKETAPNKPVVGPFKDTPDETPSLDPEGDARRAAEAEQAQQIEAYKKLEEERDRRTPKYVVAMKWTGLVVATGAVIGVVGTYLQYEPGKTREAEFSSLRAWNTVAWGALGLGVGSFLFSFYLRPPLGSPVATTSLHIAPDGVSLQGTF